MKQQLVNVGKLQAAKIAALLYLIMSIPLVLIMNVMSPYGAGGFGLGWTLLMIALYAITGAVFSFIGAWVYNGIARLVGGFEFTVVEVE